MSSISTQLQRLRPLDARTLAGFATLILGLYAFRALFAYDPYQHVRFGSSEPEDWFFRASGSSPVMLFGVAIYFLYTRQRILRDAFTRAEKNGVSWLFLAPAAALYVWAIYVDAVDLLLIAGVLTILGVGSFLGGTRALRTLLLPALFLLLLVPLPAVLINQIIYPMQLGTAWAASSLLQLVGIDSAVSADFIYTEDRLFQVIESCAGLRAMDTLIMSAVIYAELFYRTRLQAVLLVLLAPAVAVVTNLGRVLSIVFNPMSNLAAVHTLQGLIMIVVGVLLIVGVDQILTLLLPGPAPAQARGKRNRPSPRLTGAQRLQRLGVVATLLMGYAIASLSIEPWKPPPNVWRPPSQLPLAFREWQAKSLKIDKDLMGSVFPKYWTHRQYTRDDDIVELFAATDDRFVRRSSLLSIKTALPEPGFAIEARSKVSLGDLAPDADALVLRRLSKRFLVYRWYEGVEEVAVESLRSFLALDRGPFRREDRVMAWRISTRIGQSEADLHSGHQRLMRFAADLEPVSVKVRTPRPL